jgi:hypothetical protein
MVNLNPASAVRIGDQAPVQAPPSVREALARVAALRDRPPVREPQPDAVPPAEGPIRFSEAIQRLLDGPVRIMKAMWEDGTEKLRPVLASEIVLDPADYVPRDHVRAEDHPTKVYEAKGFSEEEKGQQAADVSRSALDLISKLASNVEAYNRNLDLSRRIEAVELEIGADDGGRFTDALARVNERLRSTIESAAFHLGYAYGSSGAIYEEAEDGRLAVGEFSIAAAGDGWSMTAWSDGTLQTFVNGEDITLQIADSNPLYGFKWGEPGARLDVSA